MVQFRRLDPLANADRWTRIGKSPVKSFTITQAQFLRLRERRPELVVTDDESCVFGFPYRDYLDVQYGFQEVADFRDRFTELFTRVTEASNKAEAPRGVILSFRDRPNRALADTTFWSVLLGEGAQWVEMNWVSVPEQDEPSDSIEGGYTVREATAETDSAAVAAVEAELSGLPRLTESGVASLFEYNRTVRIVSDASGKAVALVALRTEPGGWGVIDGLLVREDVKASLITPLLTWSVAWLRNHQGRRIRRKVYVDDAVELNALKEFGGFAPGETGLDYTRSSVDAREVQNAIEERQSHGTMIKFGDWR
jgi:hypothetical protein